MTNAQINHQMETIISDEALSMSAAWLRIYTKGKTHAAGKR